MTLAIFTLAKAENKTCVFWRAPSLKNEDLNLERVGGMPFSKQGGDGPAGAWA